MVGLMDFLQLLGGNGDGEHNSDGNPSPFQQGLMAFGKNLIENSQAHAGVPQSTFGLLAGALPAGTEAYKQGQDIQQLQQAAQSPDAAAMMAKLGKIQSPEIQKLILQNRLAAMTPKYEVTKDAFGNPIAYNANNPSQTIPMGGSSPFGSMGNGAPTQTPLSTPQADNNAPASLSPTVQNMLKVNKPNTSTNYLATPSGLKYRVIQ